MIPRRLRAGHRAGPGADFGRHVRCEPMTRPATGISPSGLLHGKVCIVSGVGPGLGRQAARALATHGAHLVLAARRQSSLSEVASEVREMGARALTVPTDITDPEQCAHLITRATEEFGGVDVLVNNAFRFQPAYSLLT